MRVVWVIALVGVIAVGLGAHLEVSQTFAQSAEPLAELTVASAESIEPTVALPDTSTATTEVPIVHETTTAQALQTVAREEIEHPLPPPVQVEEETPAKAEPVQKTPTIGTIDQYPVRLIIPSINLDVPIVPVGVNAKGEMDVPSGSTNNVGWFKDGTMPGNVGSAVLDAHVFAALKDLRYVKVGEPVYVVTKGGTKLRFTVQESLVYKLSDLTSDMLFGRKDARRLNIITCAGTYIPSIGTYDHRLVDYALFDVEEL